MSVFLVMEYLPNGDLERYISPSLNEVDAKTIIRQLLEGLKVLHEMDWVHRDIKPRNIFVVEAGPSWWVKIGDFGISKRLYYDGNGAHTVIGTPDYLAPEISMPDVLYADDNDSDGKESLCPTPAVDLWSLGCVLYRLFANRLPFPSQKALKAYCKGKSTLEPVINRQISEEGIEALQGMLLAQPETRWTVTAALDHAWLNNRMENPLNALQDSGPRKSMNSEIGDIQSETDSHAIVITESHQSSTTKSQIPLQQEKGEDRKHPGKEELHIKQSSLVRKRSLTDNGDSSDMVEPSASPRQYERLYGLEGLKWDESDSFCVNVSESKDAESEDSSSDGSEPAIEENYLFQRIHSKPEFIPTSLLTTLMHDPNRAAALAQVAANSAPSLHQSITSSRKSPSVDCSPKEEATLSETIIMTTSNVHSPILSPRTTRRNMLSTELTMSLRQNLLWERQHKHATRNAVLKRRPFPHDTADINTFPKAVESNIDSTTYSRSIYDYNAKGW